MKVADILKVKGDALYTVAPNELLTNAIKTMAEKDIGSLVVLEQGALVGVLTFREVMQALAKNNGTVVGLHVREAMNTALLTCSLGSDVDAACRMMLTHHARYLPVCNQKTLEGVISFYDVAKVVVETQDFENRMLKAYIHDSPQESFPKP